MDKIDQTAALQAAILNAAYMVRHYQRGALSAIGQKERARAIQRMGEVVRDSFTQSSDYEPLLIALLNGLSKDSPPPF